MFEGGMLKIDEKRERKNIPRPAEMLVELCPTPKASWTLSSLLGNPAKPEVFLIVCILDLLPVKILCG